MPSPPPAFRAPRRRGGCAALAIEGTRRLTGERGERTGLLGFFARTFPRAFQRQLGLTGLAVALFLFATAWGLALAILRPALGLSLLGPEAVRGLEEGRLWTESLVTTVPPAYASSGIATNNLSVALTAWSGGLLAGIGSLYAILLNGLMLGATFGVTLHYSMAGALLGVRRRPRAAGDHPDPGLGGGGARAGARAGGGRRQAALGRPARGRPRLPRRAARLPPLVRTAGRGGGVPLAVAPTAGRPSN